MDANDNVHRVEGEHAMQTKVNVLNPLARCFRHTVRRNFKRKKNGTGPPVVLIAPWVASTTAATRVGVSSSHAANARISLPWSHSKAPPHHGQQSTSRRSPRVWHDIEIKTLMSTVQRLGRSWHDVTRLLPGTTPQSCRRMYEAIEAGTYHRNEHGRTCITGGNPTGGSTVKAHGGTSITVEPRCGRSSSIKSTMKTEPTADAGGQGGGGSGALEIVVVSSGSDSDDDQAQRGTDSGSRSRPVSNITTSQQAANGERKTPPKRKTRRRVCGGKLWSVKEDLLFADELVQCGGNMKKVVALHEPARTHKGMYIRFRGWHKRYGIHLPAAKNLRKPGVAAATRKALQRATQSATASRKRGRQGEAGSATPAGRRQAQLQSGGVPPVKSGEGSHVRGYKRHRVASQKLS